MGQLAIAGFDSPPGNVHSFLSAVLDTQLATVFLWPARAGPPV